MPYTVTSRVPTVDEHRELAESVGWGHSFWWESMPAALAGSTCGVVAHDAEGRLVGMGRVLVDGAFYFYVQDVVVRPDHQGAGLGRRLVETLVHQGREIAPGHCFVGLFATPEAQSLYRSLGWENREMLGMWQVLRD